MFLHNCTQAEGGSMVDKSKATNKKEHLNTNFTNKLLKRLNVTLNPRRKKFEGKIVLQPNSGNLSRYFSIFKRSKGKTHKNLAGRITA